MISLKLSNLKVKKIEAQLSMFWSDLTVANSILYSKFFLNFTISLLSANIFPHACFNVGSSISDAKSKN